MKILGARAEALWQGAFAFNSLLILVGIPVSIEYITDNEFKKEYLPMFYRVREVKVTKYDFKKLVADRMQQHKDQKELRMAKAI